MQKATKAKDKDEFQEELAAAIYYFQKASEHIYLNNPVQFCLPFYRSYFAIIFQNLKEEEISNLLHEAKIAVGQSESKDGLLKAIENLSNAIQESQGLKNKPLDAMINEINNYSRHCDEAIKYMTAVKGKAPTAVQILIQGTYYVGLRELNETVDKIRKNANEMCQATYGSGIEYENSVIEIHKAANDVLAGDHVSMDRSSKKIVKHLKKLSKLFTKNEKKLLDYILAAIDNQQDIELKLKNIELALAHLITIINERSQSSKDIVILTVLAEEYERICDQLSVPVTPSDTLSTSDNYAWKFGKVFCKKFNCDYKIVVGMIGRPGTTESALAAREAVQLWKPRYILFSGIAGGLPDPKEEDALPRLGDVVIADLIYGYEYGKINKKFLVRANLTYRTDKALLNGAIASSRSDSWRKSIKTKPPIECNPKVIRGEIASGDKVIDNPSNSFFKQVLKTWPKIIAVEMEGAGVASAIEQAQSLGIPTGFMMIRGISDLPRAEGKDRGTKERDAWKIYASDVAAAFIIGWISDGLPVRPSARSIQ